MSKSLNLSFKNITTATLPFIFQEVNTTPFSYNYLAAHSPAAGENVALPKTVNEHPDFVVIFCGKLLPDSSRYTAQVYAGHQQQNNANPKYILRNYLAKTAIRTANAGDFSEIEALRTLLSTPFDEQPSMAAYAKNSPAWSKALEISCSS